MNNRTLPKKKCAMIERIKRNVNNYPVVSNAVLFSTYFISIAALVILALNYDCGGATRFGLIVCGGGILFAGVSHILLHFQHYFAAIYSLLLFYILLAIGLTWGGKFGVPLGALIFGLVIVLAGVLLSASHALLTAILAAIMLAGTQVAVMARWFIPGKNGSSGFSEVLVCGVVCAMLALAIWLYVRERERSLAELQLAEVSMLEQKAALKLQSKKHIIKLRQMQLDEMRHMYHFAEWGLQGMTLLHDLASHLTALRIETDILRSGGQADSIMPTQEIIKRLDDMVDIACKRFHGDNHERGFNLAIEVNKVVDFLRDRATEVNTEIYWEPPTQSFYCAGDADSLNQVIAIIAKNAIDAYGSPGEAGFSPSERRVVITLESVGINLIIRISDWGKGIPKREHKNLFQPFHSTKKSGLGLGLYIAKCTMEMQFSGSIELNTASDHTEFVITLPRHRIAERGNRPA